VTAHSSGSLSRIQVALGALALFFVSFLMSANSNALPQLFFQRHSAAHKTLLLSITLLCATMAATAGVFTSRRASGPRCVPAFGLVITAVLASALFITGSPAVFIICVILLQFSDNFLLNRIDHLAAAQAGEQRRFNDAAGTAARLLGMLCAPAFFTLFFDHKPTVWVTIAILGATAMVGYSRVAGDGRIATTRLEEQTRKMTAPDLSDRLIFAYGMSVYVALYLLASNAIYLLRELLHIRDAEQRGGAAIVTVFVAALVSNSLMPAVMRRSARHTEARARIGLLAAPAFVLILFATLVASGLRPGYAVFLAGGALAGLAYGVFLWAMRDFVSRSARERGQTVLLSWFNNLANVSSLLAFALMLGLASRSCSSESYFLRLMVVIAASPSVGLVLLLYRMAACDGRTLHRIQNYIRRKGAAQTLIRGEL